MKVELVPVIEISNFDQDIKLPDSGPFWIHEDEWENYNHLCNISAGFSYKLRSYFKGSSLYKIDEISNEDLLRAIKKEIIIEETEENNGIEELVYSFSGGYVLKLDNESVYFPQCCGSLADIREWEDLTIGITKSFYAGHPFPRVTEDQNKICFDFINIEIKENFAPPPLFDSLELEKSELKFAIVETKRALQVFERRVHLLIR